MRCGATSSWPWPPASTAPGSHQKVFEERFLYWADRLGYLLWGESPSWGLDLLDEGAPHRNFLAEWREIVRRDRNHPSIIAWTPFNETHDVREPRAHQRIHEDAYAVCKTLDPTRPVNDASGYVHHVTDLYTVHSYEQDPAKLGEQLADRPGVGPFRNHPDLDAPYDGQPYLIDEFGGIKWDPGTQADAASGSGQNPVSWGYGQAPVSLEEFYRRARGSGAGRDGARPHLRLVLHATHRRRAGAERDLLLRPLGEVRHGADQADLLDRAVAGQPDERRRSFHASYSACAPPVSG